MSIRQAIRRQAALASQTRGKEPGRSVASNVILAMAIVLFAAVCAIEILKG